ncbi:MAG: TonB-dependent receptor [Alphaproteobacteria bacterium]|nr:TonB-dependent receptor [Alphaproteobacteria bacterium]
MSAVQAHASAPAADPVSSIETVTITGKHVITQTIPLKAVYSTSTISQQVLRNVSPGPGVTVQTLLNQVPSIQAVTSGPAGMRTHITFRAFNDGQFGQTIDGIALNDQFNAGTSNAASQRNNILLLPQDIDNIEIHRGINNPAVNTYNSLGGTINYVPRAPGNAFGADAGVSYGSFNTFSYHATVNFAPIDGFKNLISFEHDYSDGWIRNTQDHNSNFYYSGEKDLNGGRSRLTAVFVYDSNAGYTPHSMPIALLTSKGYDYQYPQNWANSFNRNASWLAILGYDTQLGELARFDIKLYGSGNDYQRMSYANPAYNSSASQPYYLPNQAGNYAFWLSYPIPVTYDPAAVFGSNLAGNDYHFYGYQRSTGGGQTKLSFTLPYNTITAGGDFSFSQLYSREYWYGSANMPMTVGYNDAWDEHDDRILASAYIQDDIHFWNGRVHVVPGVKYLYAHTSDSDNLGFFYSNPGTVTGDDHYVSPTLGASVEALPNLVLYAAFGQNTKFPDINAYYNAFQTDVNGNFVIVPVSAKPEYVNDYEAGVRYKWNGLTAAFNYYREDFRNIFVNQTNQATGLSYTVNGAAARYQGEELMLTEELGHWLVGQWNGYLNYAHNEAVYTKTANISDTGVGATFTAGQHVPDVPQDLVSAGIVWSHDNWRASLDGQYVGDRTVSDGYSGAPLSPTVTIPSYVTLNLGLSKTVPIAYAGARAVKFSLNVDNLTDEHYFSRETTDYGYNGQYLKALVGAGRAVFGSMSVYF